MKLRQRLLTIALIAALGLGVWGVAVSFTASGFNDGDVLSAADLNNLLNSNFDAAATAIHDLENAVDGKLDRSGGSITGRTSISGAATSTGTGDTTTLFRANNTGSTGAAAVFQSSNDSTSGAVSIKQQGTGPALTLKSNGGGALITGAGAAMVTFVVEDNGSIKIGDMGTSGTGDPTLHLDAVKGTITNQHGAGLPFAYGSVSAAGAKLSGTSNWSVQTAPSGYTYYIKFDGVGYSPNQFVTVATPRGGNNAISATASSINTGAAGELAIRPRDASGNGVSDGFYFIVYQPGN